MSKPAPSENKSFLGRVFDSYQNMMQITGCIREAARQRSIEQPNVLVLSRRETPLADYLPEALITRFPTHEKNQPRLSDPVALPFADKSFDNSLITDVYEHLPSQQRPGLVSEMLRVTDGLVLIASPQGNETVTKLDRLVFDFIWGKYAERFEPLEQHALFGLEPLEQILETIRAQGADRTVTLPCNYVYRWIHQILIFFDLQYKSDYWEVFEPLNRIYNERLSPYDYREPCYRYLIAVATDRAINLDELSDNLKAPKETPALVAETDGVLMQTFQTVQSALADKLRLCSTERDILAEHSTWATQEIEHLNSTIDQLQKDNEWARAEVANLNFMVKQLQSDNKWAIQEIEHLRKETAANIETVNV